MRRLARSISDYRVTSAPMLVVNGRCLTSPAQTASKSADQPADGANQAVIAVLDALVAKSRAENAATPK